MTAKKIVSLVLALGLIGVAAVASLFIVMNSQLPQLITVKDYEPLLVSEVFDRNGQKIGEFFREKRLLVPYEEIPPIVRNAFISAEDSSFFRHGGINYLAIMRSMIANIKAGRRAQGGSTITQQVARSLLLSSEKTYTRKIKEVLLAFKMEANLSKEEILYLYLNQIYLGQGAYGVAVASQVYFRKPLKDITLPEAALLAGLPQAPSRYSPIYNPHSAKERQKYVLRRMADEGFASDEEANTAAAAPLNIYVRKDYQELAPFYLETVRQMLVKKLGEEMVLDKGLRIHTSLDLNKQLEAQAQVRAGLRGLDKRQGYRGPLENLEDPQKIAEFLLKTRNQLMEEDTPLRVMRPDGSFEDKGPLNLSGKNESGEALPNVPEYIKFDQVIKGIVTKVDDKWGLVSVRFAESKGLIDLETMEWARKPNPEVRSDWDKLKKPSLALQKGDMIYLRVTGKTFSSERLNKQLQELKQKQKKNYKVPEDLPDFKEYANIELEQEPLAQAALISFDQNTSDILAMVGGYDYEKSQFNRAIQAARQTGSSFKAIVYASALDKGYTPATPIIDAPLIYDEPDKEADEGQESAEAVKQWKPTNHSQKFLGDILFRNALIKSLNIPTVKIIEKIGVDWVADYSRRLGIFSPLNMDFTLALGSSGITLYEMTRVFSQFGRLGKRLRPQMIAKVESKDGELLLEKVSLDERFSTEYEELDQKFEERRQAYLEFQKHQQAADPTKASVEGAEKPQLVDSNGNPIKDLSKAPPLFFEDANQLIKPTTAYVTTSLLQGVVEEPGGTGGAARSLGRPVAGKTGTTNGYYDGWFIGYTPDVSTGVWVGFDEEKTMGRGEVGGRAALPIWLGYMKSAHEGLPVRNFQVPEGIVFANIDNKSGKLASSNTEQVVRQAFVDGTEPTEISGAASSQDEQNFFKEDLSE